MTFAKSGDEFLVNTATTNNQGESVVAVLDNGNFVIAWSDSSGIGDISGAGIKAQLFDPSGAPIGSPTLVNTTTFGAQYAPVITALSGGGYVIGWTDASQRAGDFSVASVKTQLFAADGARIGTEVLVNTQTSNVQSQQTVTALADGGFVFCWTDASGIGDPSYAGVKGQIFDAAGAPSGGEFLVNTTITLTQYQPTAAGLADGGFVTAWTDIDSGNVLAQRFSAAGAKLGGEFTANTTADGSQSQAKAIGLAGGGFVIAWIDASMTGDDTSGTAVRAQMFDAVGNKSGGEFVVNGVTDGDQDLSGLAALANGRFAIGWTDASASADGSGTCVKIQVYDAFGNADGAEFLANTISNGDQAAPSIAPLDTGGFVVSWTDASRSGLDLSGTAVKAQVFATEIMDQTLTGTPDADLLGGAAGHDCIFGLDGNDQLFGEGGNDLLAGGLGNDLIVGGDGIDTASFADSVIGVRVDLGKVGRQSTGAGRDTLIAVENLLGSAFHDVLKGDPAANCLKGGAGNDTLRGGAGQDHLIGGSGRDLLFGEAGADCFLFDTAPAIGNVDRIGDFETGVDKLVLSSSIFSALAPGSLADDAFITGRHALSANQHLIFNGDTGALYYDADGVGGADQLLIARLLDDALLIATDLLII